MSIIEAIVLGIVQGLTEFIPISSTAHLRIVPALLGWKDPGAAASAVIQFGTLLAVIIYFFRDLVIISRAWVLGIVRRRLFDDPNSAMGWYLILGTVPIVVIALVFKDFIETTARGLWIIAISLIVVALLLVVAEARAARLPKREIEEFTLRDAIAIGFGQSIALIPGMSRSGSTMMTALFRRFSHSAAARFSFLLSIPAIGASGLFELIAEWKHLGEVGWGPIMVAVVTAFVSGWASIWFLIHYLKTHTMRVFIVYRIVLAVVIMGMLRAGLLEN